MKRHFVLVLKGMAYGLTHIVPGMGGGLMLILLGIYEEFVEAVGNVFIRPDRWRRYVPFLVSLGIGSVVAILGFAKIITALLDRFPAPTMFFFLGLLLGTIPGVLKLHNDMRFTWRRGLALLLGLGVVILMRSAQQIGLYAGSAADVNSVSGMVYMLVTSFAAGAASVTPGMDGSYVFLLAGTYEPIMNALGALVDMEIQWAVLVPMAAGAALGIVGFSKLIDTAIKRAPSLAYYGVLGLIGGSIFALWPKGLVLQQIPIYLVTFAIGLAIAVYFARPEPEAETSAEPSNGIAQE